MSRFRPTYPVKWWGSKNLIFDVAESFTESFTKGAFWGDSIAKLMCTFPKQSHLRTTSRELLRWRMWIYERHSQACTVAEGELVVKKCLYVLELLAIWSLPQQSECVKWWQPPCSTMRSPDETKPLHLRTIWRALRPPTAESTESFRGLVLDTRPLKLHGIQGLITNFMHAVTSWVILAGRSS